MSNVPIPKQINTWYDEISGLEHGMVTLNQLVAYKDACVQEALEQAADICKELQCSPELTPEVKDTWLAIAEKRIRELMQKGI